MARASPHQGKTPLLAASRWAVCEEKSDGEENVRQGQQLGRTLPGGQQHGSVPARISDLDIDFSHSPPRVPGRRGQRPLSRAERSGRGGNDEDGERLPRTASRPNRLHSCRP